MQWKLQQDMDVGTGNPIVARMSLGMFDIIKFSQLSDDKKEKLKANCHDIMKLLVLAEKTAVPIIDEINSVLNGIKKDGVKTQSGGRCINIPAAMTIDNSRAFIKYAKQVLQKVGENINIIFDKNYEGHHFHKIRDDFVSEFGDDCVVTKLLVDDQDWIKKIIKLRNEDEHPETGKPYCNNFNIDKDATGKFIVTLPTFFEGTQIASALEVYSHNLLTFAEEITVFSLVKFFPDIAMIYEIPEDDRDSSAPVRFRIGLKPGLAK